VPAGCELVWDRKDDYRGSAVELHVPVALDDVAAGGDAVARLGSAALAMYEVFLSAAEVAVRDAGHPEGDHVGDPQLHLPAAPAGAVPAFGELRDAIEELRAGERIDGQTAHTASHLVDAAEALVTGALRGEPVTAPASEVIEAVAAEAAAAEPAPPAGEPAHHAHAHPVPLPGVLHCPGCDETVDLERLSGSSLDVQTYLCRSCGTLFEHNPLSCPRCGSDDTSVTFEPRGAGTQTWGTVALRECAACGWKSG
jgi:rubrerythrin